MSLVYATTPDGERVLHHIECDRCDARIKPHKEIADSGWTRSGEYHGPGHPENTERDLCPEHSR